MNTIAQSPERTQAIMKYRSYRQFHKQIRRTARRLGFPLRVMFELTYRCNFKCPHCYVPAAYRKYPELKTKDVFSILDQLKAIGCLYLGFTGGEPFLRKDLMEILHYARKSGFEVIIYTNGSLINEKGAKQLGQIGLNKVDVTIPAMSREAFERISGLPGSRNRVFKAIELLRKNRVSLGFKSCLLRQNKGEIKEIEDFAASLQALHRLGDVLLPRLDGSKAPFRYQVRLKGKTEAATAKPKPSSGCGAGLSQAAITPGGELKICLMIERPRYPILKTSLKDAWEKLKKSKIEGNHDSCPL